MLALGSLAFASPWLLLALTALPIIWWLLRVTPPAPRRIAFPAIRLLLGLVPREETPARTPLWLILLRMALAALVILALAHPLMNPQQRLAATGPILFIVDDGWAAARRLASPAGGLTAFWPRLAGRSAGRAGDHAPLAGDGAGMAPVRAADARAAVQSLLPSPGRSTARPCYKRLEPSRCEASSAIWVSDGVADVGSGRSPAGSQARQPALSCYGTGPGAAAARRREAEPKELTVALARCRNGATALRCRRAARMAACWCAGGDLEPGAIGESGCRCRASSKPDHRVEIEGEPSAGAVLLVDERWRRRPVGVAAPTAGNGAAAVSAPISTSSARSAPSPRCGAAGRQIGAARLAVLALPDTSPIRRRKRRPSPTGWRRAGCCCALPDRSSPRRPTSSCRCGCAAAAARSAVRCPGSSRRVWRPSRRQPVCGLAIPGRRHRDAPGAGRARARPRRQDLGAAR